MRPPGRIGCRLFLSGAGAWKRLGLGVDGSALHFAAYGPLEAELAHQPLDRAVGYDEPLAAHLPVGLSTHDSWTEEST